MQTDFSMTNDEVIITEKGGTTRTFSKPVKTVREFKPNGDLLIYVNGFGYSVLASDITINGSAPANTAAAQTSFASLFPKANPGSAVSGASTKSAANALPRKAGALIRVAADESQSDAPKAMYYDNGTALEFLFNIP